ncbi:helix-turn-helix domain-containing protein [Pseudarthrobacter sp. BIM B-2242]|uniref:helix-turn-helix domain-containing protein n=1 Tax=Pseudarthrobacter sp. BIM B-2242 TaxID=2772401 RepID=UPI00168B2B04|nr:helix-turn-helix transcriptional regulator [Pseudarthrobacter sp. BIM B-2242]QOD04885.1 helix-turn-helix transcriptional regulator [Pseudarthrobacter sp. BIM B-2242]
MTENIEQKPQGVLDEAHFVTNMQRLREQNGWSQGELARRVTELGFTNFHQTTISRIEKAERPVRLSEARGIADALGKPVDELLSTPESAAILEEVRTAVADVHRTEKRIWEAADAYESALASAEFVSSQLGERSSEVSPGSVDAGRLRYWLEELQKSIGRLPDAVIREYMEVRYGKHSEET